MKKVAFIGTKRLGKAVLEEMYNRAPEHLCGIITADDSQDARSALGSFRRFSERTNIPMHVLLKGARLEEAVKELSPDLCVVVGWYWIIKPQLLNMVPGGWLGIHGSLLPKYRGGSPLVWAMVNGETESGLTLFYFDEGMDTGDVVAKKVFKIAFDETIADILKKVEQLSQQIIRETYPSLLEGTNSRAPQDHSQATYVVPRNPADGRIDWNWSNIKIYNFIRAQTHTYPGAFCTMIDNKKLTIWRAKVFPYPYHGCPGKLVMIKDDYVVVTCGEGTAISLYTVQVENQDEQCAASVLKYGMRLT